MMMEIMTNEGLWVGLVRAAGVGIGILFVGNFWANRWFDYSGNLARVEVLVRDVFWSHKVHIMVLLLGMALGCWCWAEELVAGEGMARGMNGFMAVFWSVKVVMHFGMFDAGVKRKYRLWNGVFSLGWCAWRCCFGSWW